ncbi:MAG: MBL fold metallo-hydrolase [Ignisphaera sp.]
MGSADSCRIVVVVDSCGGSGLEVAWGLSIFVETPSSRFLFDAGPDPGVLERNLRSLGVDARGIEFAVVSHEHGDHTNGLSYMAEVRPGITVYVPKGASKKVGIRGLNIVEVDKTAWIALVLLWWAGSVALPWNRL